jgi:hypothetical protein
MSRWSRLISIVVPASLLLAVVFCVLPHTWIESTFGVDPDGGSGVLELMLVCVPIIIGSVAYVYGKPERTVRVGEPQGSPHDAKMQ